ncbi:hypothetical protein RRG08_036902 [Elysia crispata]|uniref:TNase-like domain-containing protein n=1 Tax=Elysia crispata TaxID=231223 RepID=A0AAE0ZIA1_9GAST|nr:hypothetical protein RRG08_036902 [Elysia crispata]
MISEPPPKQVLEQSVHNFIDAHLRELKWTSYGLAGLGIIIVLRRVKSTTKFSHMADIPTHFISKNYRLQGHVRNISDNGELLVEHVPILQWNFLSSKVKGGNLLKVNIAGVSLTPVAVKWVTDRVLHKNVWFRLLQAGDAVLDCDVTLKKSWLRGHFSISEELVKHGLCSVRHYHTPPSSQAYNQLLTRLLALEHKAQGKGKGLWKEEEYTGPSWFPKTTQWLKHRLNSLFRRKRKVK